MDIKDYADLYLEIANNTCVPSRDKVAVYKKAIVLKYSDRLIELLNTDKKTFIFAVNNNSIVDKAVAVLKKGILNDAETQKLNTLELQAVKENKDGVAVIFRMNDILAEKHFYLNGIYMITEIINILP